MNTHNPYDADPELVRAFLDEYEYSVERVAGLQSKVPDSFEKSISDGKYPEIREKYYFPDGIPSSAVVNAHYDASVKEADQRVGQLLQTLKDTDIYDETLIFFLSDHGESLTEHGIYYDHHGLYDQSTHVPLIVRTPDSVPRTVDDFVQITDIAPTVLSYTDTERLDADGQSLRPALTGDSLDNREYVLAEEAHTQRRRMIRSEDTKLIYLLQGDTICRYCDLQHAPEVELYDLQADPDEVTNVAQSRTADVNQLREQAETAASQYRNKCPSSTDEQAVSYEDEQEVEERLEALGYR
jgi:arylsulfatase A-like enzyme